MNVAELRSEAKPRKAFQKLYKHALALEKSLGRNLPDDVNCVLLIGYFHHEVKNGGFAQFFTNPGGRKTNETIRALVAVGAARQEEMLRRVNRLLLNWEESDDARTLGELIFGDEGVLAELKAWDREYWSTQAEVCVACVEFAVERADVFQISG